MPVQDRDRAERFYGETLGLERNPNSTETWVEFETGNVTLALVDPQAAGQEFTPLPFGSIRNRRSFIFVGNLAALLRRCAESPAAAGQTFLAADGEDLSTPELARRMAAALGRKARLVPFPPSLLPSKLAGSLAVDASETRAALDWRPPFGVDEGLARTAAWYTLRA